MVVLTYTFCPHCKKPAKHDLKECWSLPEKKSKHFNNQQKSSQTPKKEKSHSMCFNCSKKGHYKSNCPSGPKEGFSTNMFIGGAGNFCMAVDMSSGQGFDNNSWILDTGVTTHVKPTKSNLHDMEQLTSTVGQVGNGDYMMVNKKGTVKIMLETGTTSISDLYYVMLEQFSAEQSMLAGH